jgi:hypothetical protein
MDNHLWDSDLFMDKFNVVIGLFLVVLFALTLVFHLLYAKGYIFKMGNKGYAIESQTNVILQANPFSSQDQCEGTSGSECLHEQCQYIPMDMEADKVCDEEGRAWFPIISQSSSEH